ncbi:MAG: hypothetical protein ACQKBY_08110, partial [Verrucomicrobiales bacterium]
AMRLMALSCLGQWEKAVALDLVDGRARGRERQSGKDARQALSAVLPDLMKAGAEVQDEALKTAGRISLALDHASLARRVRDDNAELRDRLTALSLLASQKSPELPAVLEFALSSKETALAAAALPVLAKKEAEKGRELATQWLAREDLGLRRSALRVFAAHPGKEAAAGLATALESSLAGKWPAALILELEAAAAANGKFLPADLLARYEKSLAERRGSDSVEIAYAGSLVGGDLAKGRAIALNHLAAQCALCHAFGESGSTVGPSLAHIGSKGAVHILESLVQPNAQIAEGYGSGTIVLKDGASVSGTYLKEDAGEVRVKLADGTEKVVPRAEIQEMTPALSTMPPMGAILNRTELRDLVAYLESLK